MNVPVKANCGHYIALKTGDLSEADLERNQWRRVWNEWQLGVFRKYQENRRI
jgi:hypothetical protein